MNNWMLKLSKRQMADFQRAHRQAFIETQLAKLRARHPEAFVRAFRDDAAAVAFVNRLLAEAAAGGIDDCANLEALLDTCLAVGWLSPAARAEAGVDAMLADRAPSGPEKVTRIVNAAAFSVSFDGRFR